MTGNTTLLERRILRAFRYACQHERLDVAEFMLAALEKLDHERADPDDRPLVEAYWSLANIRRRQRN